MRDLSSSVAEVNGLGEKKSHGGYTRLYRDLDPILLRLRPSERLLLLAVLREGQNRWEVPIPEHRLQGTWDSLRMVRRGLGSLQDAGVLAFERTQRGLLVRMAQPASYPAILKRLEERPRVGRPKQAKTTSRQADLFEQAPEPSANDEAEETSAQQEEQPEEQETTSDGECDMAIQLMDPMEAEAIDEKTLLGDFFEDTTPPSDSEIRLALSLPDDVDLDDPRAIDFGFEQEPVSSTQAPASTPVVESTPASDRRPIAPTAELAEPAPMAHASYTEPQQEAPREASQETPREADVVPMTDIAALVTVAQEVFGDHGRPFFPERARSSIAAMVGRNKAIPGEIFAAYLRGILPTLMEDFAIVDPLACACSDHRCRVRLQQMATLQKQKLRQRAHMPQPPSLFAEARTPAQQKVADEQAEEANADLDLLVKHAMRLDGSLGEEKTRSHVGKLLSWGSLPSASKYLSNKVPELARIKTVNYPMIVACLENVARAEIEKLDRQKAAREANASWLKSNSGMTPVGHMVQGFAREGDIVAAPINAGTTSPLIWGPEQTARNIQAATEALRHQADNHKNILDTLPGHPPTEGEERIWCAARWRHKEGKWHRVSTVRPNFWR